MLYREYSIQSRGDTEPVSTAEAKAHLRMITGETSDDAYIASRITAAREIIEEELGMWLITTTLDYYQDSFYGLDYVQIPGYPLASVTGVYYTDEDNDESTFSSDDYWTDTAHRPGRVYLNENDVWPTELRSNRGVRVRAVCGYTNADADNKPPQHIRDLILQWLYLEFRFGRAGVPLGETDEGRSILRMARKYQLGDIIDVVD